MEFPNNLDAVLFDFDGTIVKNLQIDYDKIRNNLNSFFKEFNIDIIFRPLLNNINYCINMLKERGFDEEEIKRKVFAIIDEEEIKAIENAELQPFIKELLIKLKDKNIKIIIITRNGSPVVEKLFEKFNLPSYYFIASRSNIKLKNIKPNVEHINFTVENTKINKSNIVLIGDTFHDTEVGEKAGIYTIAYKNKDILANWVINSYTELLDKLK
jgi:HAD superfamily hydrolase (TIGR01549 family)